MNAQKLWQGSDYAMGWKPKGSNTLPVNLTRVKVVEIIKKPVFGKTKERTYVKVMILNDDGMPSNIDNPEYKTVVARDIIEHWDEYIETVDDEREEWIERKKQDEERELERKRKRQEGDAVFYIGNFLRAHGRKIQLEEAEKKRQEQLKRVNRLHNVLVGRGLRKDEFSFLEGTGQLCIKLEAVERWLGVG
jgi:hypothetical protein